MGSFKRLPFVINSAALLDLSSPFASLLCTIPLPNLVHICSCPCLQRFTKTTIAYSSIVQLQLLRQVAQSSAADTLALPLVQIQAFELTRYKLTGTH